MPVFSNFNPSLFWLRISQAGLFVVLVLCISLSLAGIPARTLELIANKDNFSPLVTGEFVVAYNLALEIILAGVFFASAAVIARYKPAEPLALFLAASLAALGATETGMTDALINPMHNPGGVIWHTPVFALRSFAMGAGLILLYSFPDEKWTPRWTRSLAYIWGALNILWFFFPSIPFNPNDGPTWRATPVASLVFGISWFGSGVLAQVMRSRQASDPIQRQQTKWSAYGLGAAVLGGAIFYGYSALKEPFVFLVEGGLMGTVYVIARPTIKVIGMGLLPVCLGVAILRYRLFEIDLIISRTLLYTTLTGLLLAVYLLVAGGISSLLEGETTLAAILAAGIVAILLQPLREFLQRNINRIIFGVRDDPYQLLSSLGSKLEGAFAPQEALNAITETIGRGLKIPYTAIAIEHPQGWQVDAQYPSTDSPSDAQTLPAGIDLSPESLQDWEGALIPINYQGKAVGKLLLSPRTPGEPFSRSDMRLLEDLARQAGSAVHNVQLHQDLLLARQRLVNMREEERRRLRRDLHDSLGPTLASLTLQADAARNLVERQPKQAEELLEAIACQTQEAVDEVRRIVHGLRPPALDELGLVAALQEKALQHQQSGLRVSFQIPETLPPLPAAVEVATYRIVLEALTNVSRHAQAQRCQITLKAEPGALWIEVADDGVGYSASHTAGTGLHSMRERAIELGGEFQIRSNTANGTPFPKGACLQARLPLPDATVKADRKKARQR